MMHYENESENKKRCEIPENGGGGINGKGIKEYE